ncbi:putative Ig domain-containing protein [Aeromicrobium sp. IC_218]|uniref:putative Ig domain-containing protein n=1 Tax=Aeromicrobium sp. IC_218 TaxID=2545468 RepID=UPI0010408BB9|nr:putative Ig domain-containing protein [Aeromicrobium sp. IC_218]TCI96330.1 hypothetical protein E0W78_15180 [Aeromicrobium sp. IC_218]
MRHPLARLVVVALVAAGLPLTGSAVASAAPVSLASPCSDPLVDEAQPAEDALAELPDAEVAAVNDLSVPRLREEARDEALWVDPCGRLYAVEEAPAEPEPADVAPPVARAATDAFALHSRPGAPRTIYLDFTGHSLTRTAWNSERPTITVGAWSSDADPATFSAAERATVAAVWESVAADYAAWDVDVTTQDPGVDALVRTSTSDARYGMRVLVAGDSDGMQTECGCGGVAFVGVFDRVGGAYQPALVFGRVLGSAKAIAEAASHEAGHTFGLFHDGDASAAYHVGTRPWAPIMGVGYYQPVSQWSHGEYAGATSTQDDTAIISSSLPLLRDDHAGPATLATATPLTSSAAGVVTGPADQDSFAVESLGAVTVTATPTSATTDLDVELVVTDASGVVRQRVNPAATRVSASVASGLGASAQLAAGRHVVTVRGGAGPGYSAYGSLGAYRITATGEVAGTVLTAARTVAPAVVGRPYTATVVTGGTPPLSWSGADVPPGLVFTDDGRLTGTPTATAGPSPQVPVVRDATGRTVELAAWSGFAVETPLTPIAASLPRATRGRPYAHLLGVTSAPADVRWSASDLPTGLALDTDGRLSGTPARAGTSTVTLTAASGRQSRTQRVPLVVQDVVGVSTSSVPTAVVGTAYRARLGATGGDGRYRWTATGLPAGLALAADGTLSGRPRAVGTTRVTVTASSAATTATRQVTVVVRRTVSVRTRTVRSGRLGRAYRSDVRIDGGRPTFVWRATGVPRGVRLVPTRAGTRATLQGRPRRAGTYRVRVRVADATGRAVTRTLTLRVRR